MSTILYQTSIYKHTYLYRLMLYLSILRFVKYFKSPYIHKNINGNKYKTQIYQIFSASKCVRFKIVKHTEIWGKDGEREGAMWREQDGERDWAVAMTNKKQAHAQNKLFFDSALAMTSVDFPN